MLCYMLCCMLSCAMLCYARYETVVEGGGDRFVSVMEPFLSGTAQQATPTWVRMAGAGGLSLSSFGRAPRAYYCRALPLHSIA